MESHLPNLLTCRTYYKLTYRSFKPKALSSPGTGDKNQRDTGSKCRMVSPRMEPEGSGVFSEWKLQ